MPTRDRPRLYLLQTGVLQSRAADVDLGGDAGTPCDIPVPWYLLLHPDGHVVVDGGIAVECATDARGYWGEIADDYRPVMDPAEGCVRQLAALGIAAQDVRYVVLSHLHLDHTGAAGRFPRATYIVRRAEHELAFAPAGRADASYCRHDLDRPGLAWHCLDGGLGDRHDLFGDGSFVMISTPGHSPGHQSFLVTLADGPPFLLAVDAAYTMRHWRGEALPGFMTSKADALRSLEVLRQVAAACGAKIVPGHDAAAWQDFRHAPAYYE